MGVTKIVSSLLDKDPFSESNLQHALYITETLIGGYYVTKWIGRYALNKYNKYVRNKNEKEWREMWAKVGKYVVVLRQYPRSVLTPSPSPFALKLETYLRMADIPYHNDFEEPYNPNGETIRIATDGDEIVGSQSSMEFLGKKFRKDFSSSMSPTEKATVSAFQIMCEEHLHWVLVLWWLEFSEGDILPLILPTMSQSQINKEMFCWKRAARNQGMGCLTGPEVTELAIKDLRALSLYLGSKPYFTGDKPTEADCAFFGILAQIVWAAPKSTLEHLVNSELVNLKQFCERMKNEFWPDWNECLHRGS